MAEWLGVCRDAAANHGGRNRISAADRSVTVWVIRPDEEHVIAHKHLEDFVIAILRTVTKYFNDLGRVINSARADTGPPDAREE
jgi:hypothetical protein